jgi:amino acid adenylation domain-containing protein
MNNNAELLEKIRHLSPERQQLLLRRMAAEKQAANTIPRQADRAAPSPMSFSQQQLWFMAQLEGASAKYNMPCAYRLAGRMDVPAMQAALKAIVRRHEVLRSAFREIGGEPVQVVDHGYELDVPFIDLSAEPEALREEKINALIQENIDWHFDVACVPLVRMLIVRAGDDDHVLVMNLHHIIYDGRSKGILLVEMAALYDSLRSGGDVSSALPELPLQYRDYSAWQRSDAQAEAWRRQLDYWRGKLHGITPLIDLPLDLPRPAECSGKGAALGAMIPRFLAEKMEHFARQEGASTYMATLAAFKVLLYRLSGQRDIVVGTPSDNRSREETQQLIGLFLNSLVLRTPLDPQWGFRRMLAEVKATCLESYQNQDLPFDQIVNAVAPARSLGYTPMYQVMFVFQNRTSAQFELPGLRIAKQEASNSTSKYDLYLTFQETDDGLQGWWTYNSEIYTQATLEHYSGCLLSLIADCMADPDKPIARLALQETAALLEYSRGAPAATGADELDLAGRIGAQAAAQPQRVALIDANRSITYAELWRRAGALAQALAVRGVGRGALVGIALRRGAEQLAAQIAARLRGAAFALLEPAGEAADRLAAQAGCAALFVHVENASTQPALAEIAVEQVADADAPAQPPLHAAELFCQLRSSHARHAVQVTVAGAALGVAAQWDGSGDDIVACGLAGDGIDGLVETWAALAHGATVLLAGERERRDSFALLRSLRKHAATRIALLPNQLARLLAAAPQLGEDAPALRQVTVCADSLAASHADALAAALPQARLRHSYAAAETMAAALAGDIDAGPVHAGRPAAGSCAYVSDEHGRLCAAGIAGDLWLGGEGLAQGYANDARATADALRPDPWSARPGARLLRSGDRARWHADGRLRLLDAAGPAAWRDGRRLDAVQLRDVVLQCEGVEDAIVLARGGALEVHAVAREESSLRSEDILAAAAHGVPDYMQPAQARLHDALPLLANGRVNRGALARAAAGGVVLSERLAAQEDYWRAQLADLPVSLALPFETRPQAQPAYALQAFTLPPALCSGLLDLGREAGASPLAALQGLLAALLACQARQQDIAILAPVAFEGEAPNTLVLRQRLDARRSFAALLADSGRILREALANAELSEAHVRALVRAEQGIARERLADVCLVLREAATQAQFDADCAETGVPLGLVVDPHSGAAAWAYRSDLFDVRVIAALGAQLAGYGQRLLAAAQRPLHEVTLLSAAETAALRLLAGPQRDLPAAADVLDIFAQVANASPSLAAVEDSDGQVLSYAELDRRSDAVARWLLARGLGLETRVALHCGRDLALVPAMLGILKAGACYVPLDPAYPAARRLHMLGVASPALLVHDEALDFDPAGVQAITLAELTAQAAAVTDTTPLPRTPGSAAAYVMFTSGSTGLPKGVAVTRANLASYARGAALAYGIRSGERMLQQSALSFDLATEEIFLPLLNAGTVVLYARERELSAAFLENYLVTRRVGVASVPTAYWHAWAAAGEGAAPAGHALRLLITGGEAPSAAVLQKWRARWPQTAWVNSYGPTETTVITALWQLPGDDAVAPLQRLPAGTAIPGLSCLVCAEDGQLQPQGAIGELLLGGASVARGYLNDARATAQRFVPDAHGEPGARCYRSGDLARYSADGLLEIVGRADAQIKLRGFRVEPGEITEQLKSLHGVQDAAVLVLSDAAGNKRLAACWVGAGLDAEAVRTGLAARLPEYLLPDHLIALPALPLTPAGKVDNAAILAALELASQQQAPVDPPQTETEQALLEIWQGLLGDAPLGRQTSFFGAGGHSLLAVRLCHAISQRFGVELPVLEVFRAPQLARMAQRVDELAAARSVVLTGAAEADEDVELFQI